MLNLEAARAKQLKANMPEAVCVYMAPSTDEILRENIAKGSIISGDLDISATTTGMLKNDAKAKVVSKEKEDESEDADSRTDSEKWTKWSKQGEE